MEPVELYRVDIEVDADIAESDAEERMLRKQPPRLLIQQIAVGPAEPLTEQAAYHVAYLAEQHADGGCRRDDDSDVKHQQPLSVNGLHERAHRTHGTGDDRHEYSSARIAQNDADILRHAAQRVYAAPSVAGSEVEAHRCGEAEYRGGVVLYAPAEVPLNVTPRGRIEIRADVPHRGLRQHGETEPHEHFGKIQSHVPPVVPAGIAVDEQVHRKHAYAQQKRVGQRARILLHRAHSDTSEQQRGRHRGLRQRHGSGTALGAVPDKEDHYSRRQRNEHGPHEDEILHLVREYHAHRIEQRRRERKDVVKRDQRDTRKQHQRDKAEFRALGGPAYENYCRECEQIKIGISEFPELCGEFRRRFRRELFHRHLHRTRCPGAVRAAGLTSAPEYIISSFRSVHKRKRRQGAFVDKPRARR